LGRELFQGIFALGIFLGGVGRYAATPLIVALPPGHSDITRFRPWSPIATGDKSITFMNVDNFKNVIALQAVFLSV